MLNTNRTATARRAGAIALAPVAMLALTACGGGGSEEAQAVFDACNRDAEIQLLSVDGSSVVLAVEGENARALAGAEDQMDDILAGGDAETDGPSPIGVSMGLIVSMDCLVEETNYPGSSDSLRDGEEWDGWTFTEESGAGSEFRAVFTAS